MKNKFGDITIEYDKIEASYTNDTGKKVTYPKIEVKNLLIKTVPFREIILEFNELNYLAVNYITINENIKVSTGKIFAVITRIKDPLLSRAIADYYFNQFTILWQYLVKINNKHILGVLLWNNLLNLTLNWESKTKGKIHKGTPYFFLGSTFLFMGDLDKALLFISNAIEEDKRFSDDIGILNFYKELPAYMFSTMDDNPNNFLLREVKMMKEEIEKKIDIYNKTFTRTFSFTEFDRKFLKNDLIEPEKYFFVYTILMEINLTNKMREELKDNSFLRLKNADLLFDLCLVIDNILYEYVKKDYVSGKVKEICAQKFGLKKSDCETLKNNLDFDNKFDQASKNCLSLNHQFNGQDIKPEILTLLLLWGLRNFGGHNIKEELIFSEKFDELVQAVLNSLFILLEYVFP